MAWTEQSGALVIVERRGDLGQDISVGMPEDHQLVSLSTFGRSSILLGGGGSGHGPFHLACLAPLLGDQNLVEAAGIAGMLIGIVLALALPRFLPLSLDTHIAGLVMGRDRVGAGRAVIEAADPAGHRDMMTGGWVYETNRAALDKCIAAMLQTK
jgi:hypothetical protein